MGLIRSIYNGIKAAQYPRSGVLHTQPWPMPTPLYEVTIESSDSRTLYIYDPRPLAGVRVGQMIVVEAFRGFTLLKSKHTGFEVECGHDRDTAFMYNGQIIGCASVLPQKVRIAAEHGYALKFHAYARGTLPQYGNLLDMCLLCPERVYLYEYVPDVDDRPSYMRDDVLTYYARSDMELAALGMRDNWEFSSVQLDLLPVPDGSIAKPHIKVTADSKIISEISARRSKYWPMRELMEKYTFFKGYANRYIDEDGEVYYIVKIYGK